MGPRDDYGYNQAQAQAVAEVKKLPGIKVVEEEKTMVKILQDQGRMGAIRLAVPHGKVFLEVFAADAAEAEATVRELPMCKWWDLEVYPLSGTA